MCTCVEVRGRLAGVRLLLLSTTPVWGIELQSPGLAAGTFVSEASAQSVDRCP